MPSMKQQREINDLRVRMDGLESVFNKFIEATAKPKTKKPRKAANGAE